MQKDINLINDFEADLSKNLNYLPKYELISLKKKLQNIKKNKKKIIIIGNGGSSSIASHFSVDMTKNAKIRTINFNEPNLITCFSNDYGFEKFNLKALEYYADKGDLLIIISSSGNSKNLLNAARFFKKKNFGEIVTLTGMSDNNKIKKIGDINFWVNSNSYNVIESLHQIYLLILVDLLVGKLNYKSNL